MNAQQEITEYLTGLWRELVGRDVGLRDDFFEAGGTSLAGMRMLMEVQKRYSVDLDLETFFEDPCIATLADGIARSVPGTVAS